VVPPEQLAELPELSEVEKTPERKNWRLAAGYFAFFMCGWGEVYFTIYILLQLCIPDPIVISSRVRSHQVKPRQLNIT